MLEVRQSSGSEAEEVGGVRGVAFDTIERRQFISKLRHVVYYTVHN